jgi:hypothetical protein
LAEPADPKGVSHPNPSHTLMFSMAKSHRLGAAKLDADRRPIAAGRRIDRAGIGPYSRTIDRGAIGGLIGGRSREGRFLRRYEAMLTEHVGGNPSIVQRALISRAARLALHLELMDERSWAITSSRPTTTSIM